MEEEDLEVPVCQVVFVLGAPGSGKGTQCSLITSRMKGIWAHLSAGDLLRAERKKGGELGDLINERIASGKLVPSSVTCKLLENAMGEAYRNEGITKFLIDGYPRSHENAEAWESSMSRHTVEFVIFYQCPEDILVGRLLERGQTSGRNDDNIEVIRKRFKTFEEENLPILQLYDKKGLVRTIQSDQSVEEVYSETRKLVEKL